MKQTYATAHCHVKRIDRVAVLKPHGNLMGGPETDELEKLIDEFDGQGIRCLVVNLAIGRLVSGHVKFKKRDARMNLCNLDKRIENIFVITKLSLEFNVYPSEEEAIAGCAADE